MIGFKLLGPLSGAEVELDEGTSIEMQLKNPIFADDGVIPSTYTIPFDIPASDLNAEKLGRPHVIEHASKFKKAVPVRLDFNRVPWLTGQLNIRNVNERKYSVNFLSGINNLGDDFKNARLRDVVSEEIIISNSSIPRVIHLQGPIHSGTTMIINGISVKDNFLTPYEFINKIESEVEGISVIFHESGFMGGGQYYYEIIADSQDPLSELTISIEGEGVNDWEIDFPFLDAYLDEIYTWLNQYISAAPPDDIIRFPLAFNTLGGYSEDVKDRIGKNGVGCINLRHGNEFMRNTISVGGLWAFEVHNRNSITPFVMFRHVLDKIQESTAIKLAGSFIESPFIDQLLWWNNHSIDAPQIFINNLQYLFLRRSFNVNEFVPDIDLATLFKELQKLFCLSIEYKADSNTIYLDYRKDIILDKSYTDITGMASKYDDLDNVEDDGLVLKSKQDTSDKRVETITAKNPFAPITIGGGSKSIETAISGVPEASVRVTDVGIFIGPIWGMESMGSSFAPRLMFYDGIQTTSGNTYARARQTYLDYSLEWTSQKGFYEMFWKEYARFLYVRAKVQRNINFDIADLLSLDWKQKYRIDRVNYLIESITVRMTMKGMKAGKAELWKCG